MRVAFVTCALLLAACGIQTSDTVNGVTVPDCNRDYSNSLCNGIIPPGSIGTGPAFTVSTGYGLGINTASLAGTQLYLLAVDAAGVNTVFRVDTTTGARTVVSTATLGTRFVDTFGWSIGVSVGGIIPLVTPTGLFTIREETGERTLVASAGTSLQCPPLASDIMLDTRGAVSTRGGAVIVAGHTPGDAIQALLSIDQTGCTTLSAWTLAVGAPLVGGGARFILWSPRFVLDASTAFSLDTRLGMRLQSIDLATGGRTEVIIAPDSGYNNGASGSVGFGAGELTVAFTDVLALDVRTHQTTEYLPSSGPVRSSLVAALPHPSGWPLMILVTANGVATFNRANGRTAWLSR